MSDTLPVVLLAAAVGVGAYSLGKQHRARRRVSRERVPAEVMTEAVARNQPVVRAQPDVITDDEVFARHAAHREEYDVLPPAKPQPSPIKHGVPKNSVVQAPPPKVQPARTVYYVPEYLSRESNPHIAQEESGVESFKRSSDMLRAMADPTAVYQRNSAAAVPLADDVPTVERIGNVAGSAARGVASVPKYLSRATVAARDEAVHQAGLFRKGWRNAFGEIS